MCREFTCKSETQPRCQTAIRQVALELTRAIATVFIIILPRAGLKRKTSIQG